MFLVLWMDYKQTKNSKRTLQFAAIAFILQFCLMPDVLFYLFQGINPTSVQFTWLYTWNSLLGPTISGTTVVIIAAIGCFIAYKIYTRKSHR